MGSAGESTEGPGAPPRTASSPLCRNEAPRVSCLSPRPVSLPLEEAAREMFSGEQASQHSSVSVTSGRGERPPSCTARAGRGMDGCLREMSLPKQAERDIYSSLKITKESYLSSWEIASFFKLGHYIL